MRFCYTGKSSGVHLHIDGRTGVNVITEGGQIVDIELSTGSIMSKTLVDQKYKIVGGLI